MTIFLFCSFIFFSPIINVLLPKIFEDINIVVWLIFYLLVVSFILRQTFYTKKIPQFNLWLFLILFFHVVVVISITWSGFYSYDVITLQRLFARVFVPFIIVFIAFNLVKGDRELNIIVTFAFASAIILSLISIYQVIFDLQMLFQRPDTNEIYRASGTFSNPNALAIYLVLLIPLILMGFENCIISKKFEFLTLLIISGGVLCTISRKGIGTALISFILFYILKRKWWKLVCLSLVVLIGIVILTTHGDMFTQRLSEKKFEKDLEGKTQMLLAGLTMFKQSPLIGHGYQGYYENFKKYFPLSVHNKYDAHNSYITVLANYGLLGFTFFLGILFFPLLKSWRAIKKNSKPFSAIGATSLISILTYMFNSYFAGGLLDFWPISIIFYSNVILIFSINRKKNSV